jgi:membrane protease YdiL (CAAX protease family)
METSFLIFFAISVAYAAACGLWLLLNKYYPAFWPSVSVAQPDSRYKDILPAIMGCLGIVGMGQLYQIGWLLPEPDHRCLASASWVLNNLLIFSPVFIVLYFRKQSLNSVFLCARKIGVKIGFGPIASLVAMYLFYLIEGSEKAFIQVFIESMRLNRLRNFPAVFLDGVAIAFLFVRLRWLMGLKWAIVIPSVLFGLAHLATWSEGGDWLTLVLPYFLITIGITMLVLYTTNKSKDIIWLGIVHFLMNQAIVTFGS